MFVIACWGGQLFIGETGEKERERERKWESAGGFLAPKSILKPLNELGLIKKTYSSPGLGTKIKNFTAVYFPAAQPPQELKFKSTVSNLSFIQRPSN